MKQLVEDCLSESKQFFGTRKYQAGASQVEDAARIIRSMPREFPQYDPVNLVSTAVEFLNNEYEAAEEHNNRQASWHAAMAEEGLLRILCSWEPTNTKWSQMQATCQKYVESRAAESNLQTSHGISPDPESPGEAGSNGATRPGSRWSLDSKSSAWESKNGASGLKNGAWESKNGAWGLKNGAWDSKNGAWGSKTSAWGSKNGASGSENSRVGANWGRLGTSWHGSRYDDQANERGSYCSHCGHWLPVGATSCYHCGAPVKP